VRLYVARHGETDWNYEGRYQGRRESSLTPLGLAQAQALADALAGTGAARVISSPLRRCTETARSLAERLGAVLELDDRLMEIAHGTWEGRLRAEIERDDPQRLQAWQHTPQTVQFAGGESLADVDRRWRAFTASLAGEDDVIAVTHDVLVRLAVLAATGREPAAFWQPRVCNGGYALLEKAAGGWRLIDECRIDHLDGLLADTNRQAL
jgi:broad specificity phosphatase PhoE